MALATGGDSSGHGSRWLERLGPGLGLSWAPCPAEPGAHTRGTQGSSSCPGWRDWGLIPPCPTSHSEQRSSPYLGWVCCVPAPPPCASSGLCQLGIVPACKQIPVRTERQGTARARQPRAAAPGAPGSYPGSPDTESHAVTVTPC